MLKPSFIASAIAALLALSSQAQTPVKLYGVMMQNKAFATPRIASFNVGGDFDYTDLVTASDYSLSYTGGGFATPDGAYYAVSPTAMVRYNTSDWSAAPTETPFVLGTLGQPHTTTYDPASAKVYGCFMDKPFMWPVSYSLCSVDLTSGVVTPVIPLPGGEQGKCYGLAATSAGDLFLILAGDTQNASLFTPALYRVAAGESTLEYIGNTGVNLQTYYADATIDLRSGRMFWAVDATYNSGVIYEVDLATGACTKLLTTPGGEQFIGIAAAGVEQVSPLAPAYAVDPVAVFTDADGSADVSFTIPALTYGGQPLSGQISWAVTCAGSDLVSGQEAPGRRVSTKVKVSHKGKVTLGVRLASDGASSTVTIDTYAGADTPAAPGNVTASATGNDITVDWVAPSCGVNGGYVDAASLTYRVVLQPSGFVAAEHATGTSLSFKGAFTEPTALRAEVTPLAGATAGTTASSAKFVAGDAFRLPWHEDFSADGFDLFTVADVASDDATWSLYAAGQYASCDKSDVNPKDDWLFTPALKLRHGMHYTLSFSASALMANSYEELLEVKAGNIATPQAMTITILEPAPVRNRESWAWSDYTVEFTVSSDGDYNIGFHAMSAPARFKIGLDNIRVEGASAQAPAPVVHVEAAPAPDGAHSATVWFDTPTLTAEGKSLGALTSAEVYVNSKLAATVRQPAAGERVTVDIETVEGHNSIEVYTSNAAGRSIAARSSVYTGADAPAAVTGFTASADGLIVNLSWDIPKGVNGGFIEPDSLGYLIGRYVNGGELELLSALGPVTSYADTCDVTVQTPIIYILAAENNIGNGASALSNCVIVGGNAYTLPFSESFVSGFSAYDIWQNQTVGQSGVAYWRMWSAETDTDVTPADADQGAVVFQPTAVGESTRLFSGCIDLTSAANPVLEFWYCGLQAAGQQLDVEASADGVEWTMVRQIVLDDKSADWTCVKLPLGQYNTCGRFQIAFRGTARESVAPVLVDRISIRDVRAHDLSLSLAARRNFYPGEAQPLTATVVNYGSEPSSAYAVEFYADDHLIGSVDMAPLAVDESAVASVDHMIDLGYPDTSVIEARAVYAADDYADNNSAQSQAVNHLPLYPAPQALTCAGQPGNYLFDWAAPLPWQQPESVEVTDDFEAYDPFVTGEIGEWITVDVDGDEGTFGIIGLHFPLREAAKSWQLFNLWALGIEMADDEVTWRPSSGHQFLVSFADRDRRTDDWLISPVLIGHSQTISFMTRSLNTFWYGEESFEVYASSTGRNLADFKLVTSATAPGEWTRHEVELPEGTMYFAIKCTSEGYKFAMGLDDITYTPGTGIPDPVELAGYNFYRNGMRVNDAVLSPMNFTDTQGSSTDSYAVTAVYTTGESRFSNVVVPAGISAVNADAASSAVRVVGRDIMVDAPEGTLVEFYTSDGRLCHRAEATADGAVMQSAPAGVYIVRAGTLSAKAAVR